MKLKDYLRIKNISHSSFSKRIGMTRNYVSLITAEKKRPSVDLAEKIHEETDGYVSIDELLFPRKHKDLDPDEILKIVSEYKKNV